MEKLYYHKDKNFLMDWLMLNNMSTGEIALWHTLMNIGNRLGQKNEFNAPTSTLMKLTGLSKQGTVNARKKLMDRGFIAYEKGKQHRSEERRVGKEGRSRCTRKQRRQKMR